ncbi:MAG: TauD/TfdA family dioxygenase [Burkholderiaceae bacterium]|nr:TauD/TfdA family dioxygenase [Burkholderiaceae bacterium]
MLASIEQHGNIVVAQRDFSWGMELANIAGIVARHFPDFNGNGFYPHPQEQALQRELMAVPALRQLSQMIGRAKARGMAITNLGLSALCEAQRNAVLYAIALCRGFPTSTDQRTKRVAWDVRARQTTPEQARFVTFSERVGGADMHTDSSFYPMPEEQFLLYVVSAARCNGGASLLIDVEDVERELQKTAEGRAAFELLQKTPVPFRVPSVYAAKDEQLEYHQATVFHRLDDGSLAMRWRYDSISKGLDARPELGSPALLAALALLNEVIEKQAPRFERQLPDDTLLWADNHRTLHGRGTYTDPARHLIRIRISNTPNADRVGPSGIAAD